MLQVNLDLTLINYFYYVLIDTVKLLWSNLYCEKHYINILDLTNSNFMEKIYVKITF